MLEISERKIGVLLSYLNIALQTIVNFLYIPLLIYYIGREGFGLYQLVGSLIAYFGIMELGLSGMAIRFYTRYRTLSDVEGAENILAIAQRGYWLVAVMVAVLGGLGYIFLPDVFGESLSATELQEGMEIYLLMLANFIFSLLGMVYGAIINAWQKYLFLRGTACLQTLLQPLLVLIVLQKYPYALAVAAAGASINLSLIVVRIIYVRYKLAVRIAYHYWNRELVQEIGYFTLTNLIVSVVDLIFFRTNQVILGIVSGTAAVAVYAIAANIQNAYMSISSAVSGVFLPHVTEMVAKKVSNEELSALFIRIGRLQFLLLGLIASGFIIFGQEFILLWAGEDFADAYWMALLIILPFTTDLIQNIGFAILQAMNRYGLRAVVHTLVGFVNIVLAVPLGMKYGGIGCAAATGLCMLLGNGIGMSYCYAQYLHLQMGRFWRQIFFIFLPIAVLTVVMYSVNYFLSQAGGLVFGIKVSIYTALYGIVAYFFCFNGYERFLCVGWFCKR